MKRQQSGFTLIELIMVIVVLGILAAFALPRFADFGTDARVAALNGLAGSLRSAAAIAHSAHVAGQDPVILEGETIAMVEGYPQAFAGGIDVAAQVDGFTPSTGAAIAGAEITFTPDSYTGTGVCNVSYTAATTAGLAPVVAVNDDDC